jgi:hypothetical protein
LAYSCCNHELLEADNESKAPAKDEDEVPDHISCGTIPLNITDEWIFLELWCSHTVEV